MNRPAIGALLVTVALRVSAAPSAAPTSAGKPASQPATPSAPASSGVVSIRVRVPPGDARFAAIPAASLQGDVATISLADDRVGKVPLAAVEDELVTVDDLREVAALTHEDRSVGKAGKMDFSALLDRLVGVRVIDVEARNMGVDDLEEVKNAIVANQDKLRFDLVRRSAIAGVKPAPAEVERRYKQAALEWKLRSVVFPKREDAVALGAQLAGGGDFEKLAAKAVADKKAKGGDARWMRVMEISPAVAKQVKALPARSTSAPIEVKEGWTLIRLEESRVAKDEALRAQVRSAVAGDQAKKTLEAYYARLKKQYATVDQAVLKSVNLDSAKPGIPALLKDKRVVARVKGSTPITVADVTEEVVRPLFHGIEAAQQEKRLDKEKKHALDALVSKRLVVIEAERLKIDQSPEFKKASKDFETNLYFTQFVDRVVIPDVKVPDSEVKAAYEKRKSEFTYPAFYKLQGLAFADAKKAQAALKTVQAGTDFKWLMQNADGAVAPNKDALALDGSTVSSNQMPDDLKRVLTGAKEGDVRLWDQAGQTFIVHVASYTPERVRPFEEVQGDVGKMVFGEALSRKVDEWIVKLRAAHDVKVFLVSGK